jgi:hypothetical protein
MSPEQPPLAQRIAGGLGSFFLFACVIGRDHGAEPEWREQCHRLARQHACGRAILFVLITVFGPISGAH